MDTLWERTRHAFERILQEGEKAAERMVGSFEEMGDIAKGRLEKARLERNLFKEFAKLGNAVYEHAKSPRTGDGAGANVDVLDQPEIEGLLEEVGRLDAELTRAETHLSSRRQAQTPGQQPGA